MLLPSNPPYDRRQLFSDFRCGRCSLILYVIGSYKYYGVQVLEYLYPLSHEKKSVLGVQNILRILAFVLQSTFYAFSSTKAMY